MSNLEIMILIYVSVNVPVAIWHLVLIVKRENDQRYRKHLQESIASRDATITRQEQMLARNEKLIIHLEQELK